MFVTLNKSKYQVLNMYHVYNKCVLRLIIFRIKLNFIVIFKGVKKGIGRTV